MYIYVYICIYIYIYMNLWKVSSHGIAGMRYFLHVSLDACILVQQLGKSLETTNKCMRVRRDVNNGVNMLSIDPETVPVQGRKGTSPP